LADAVYAGFISWPSLVRIDLLSTPLLTPDWQLPLAKTIQILFSAQVLCFKCMVIILSGVNEKKKNHEWKIPVTGILVG
jgi:hypothetical protein